MSCNTLLSLTLITITVPNLGDHTTFHTICDPTTFPYQALRQGSDVVLPQGGVVFPGQSAQLVNAEADGLVWAHSQQEALLQPELVDHLLPCLMRNLKVSWPC